MFFEIFLNLATYCWILIYPCIGFIFGGDVVVRILFFIILKNVFVSNLRNLGIPENLCSTALHLGYLFLPVTIIPNFMIWIFKHFLSSLELVWQMLEVVGVVHISMKVTELVRDRLDDFTEDVPAACRAVLPAISCVCTAGSCCLLYQLCIMQHVSVMVYIALLGVLAVLLGFNVAVYFLEPFELSEASLVGACSLSLLWCVAKQQQAAMEPLATPQSWDSYTNESYFSLCLRVITDYSGAFYGSFTFVQSMLSVWFLLSLCIRACCMLTVVDICMWFLKKLPDWEESGDWEYEGGNGWNSASVRSVLWVVYTQFILQHLSYVTQEQSTWLLLKWLGYLVPNFRFFQVGFLLVYYMYRVYLRVEE